MNDPYRPNVGIEFPKTSRDKNLDLVGTLHSVAGGLAFLGTVFVVGAIARATSATPMPASPGPGPGTIFGMIGAAWLATGWTAAALLLGAGWCLRRRRAHAFCVVVAALSCLSIPVGTALGVSALVLLTKPDVRAAFELEGRAPQDPPAVRPWLLVLAAAVVIGAASFFAGTWIAGHAKGTVPPRHRSPPTTPRARELRAQAPFAVAFGPIPSGLPLLGPAGVDADKYPTQYVDRPGLRSLLHARRFKALDDDAEQLQAAFEADPRKEYWPIDLGEAFGSAEPDLEPDLDAWVATSPGSFAARLARGSHEVAVMWAMRGSRYSAETPEEDKRAMRVAGQRALGDLDEALRLRPRLVAAMRQEMRVAMAISDDARLSRLRARALEACPSCLQPRATVLRALTPRWGGAPGAMRAFAATSPVADNPRLKALAGYEDLDRAQGLEEDRRFADALAAVERAERAGEYWEYLLEHAEILGGLERFDEALPVLDRADAQRPMHPAILVERAHVEYRLKKYVAAGRDLLATLRIEPSNVRAKDELAQVLGGVLWQAQKLEADHQHEAALEAADLALDLGPTEPHAENVRAWIVLGNATTPERVAELTRHVQAHPADFRAVQQLDYALSRQNRYPEILVLWDAYLAARPNDGRAYMERAGTNHHLGRVGDSRADAARACELGVSEGCERVAAP